MKFQRTKLWGERESENSQLYIYLVNIILYQNLPDKNPHGILI